MPRLPVERGPMRPLPNPMPRGPMPSRIADWIPVKRGTQRIMDLPVGRGPVFPQIPQIPLDLGQFPRFPMPPRRQGPTPEMVGEEPWAGQDGGFGMAPMPMPNDLVSRLHGMVGPARAMAEGMQPPMRPDGQLNEQRLHELYGAYQPAPVSPDILRALIARMFGRPVPGAA